MLQITHFELVLDSPVIFPIVFHIAPDVNIVSLMLDRLSSDEIPPLFHNPPYFRTWYVFLP
jgi:hypothetical protein